MLSYRTSPRSSAERGSNRRAMACFTFAGRMALYALLILIANRTMLRETAVELYFSFSSRCDERLNCVAATFIASLEKNRVAIMMMPAPRIYQMFAFA